MKIVISREQLRDVLMAKQGDKTIDMIVARLKVMTMQRGPHTVEIT